MNTYILMSMMEDYLRVPERIRTILQHATPAELVRRALPIGNKRSFINLAAMPLHYLTGRELFVDLGENTLADGLEDQLDGAAVLARGHHRDAHRRRALQHARRPGEQLARRRRRADGRDPRHLLPADDAAQGGDPQVRRPAHRVRVPGELRRPHRRLRHRPVRAWRTARSSPCARPAPTATATSRGSTASARRCRSTTSSSPTGCPHSVKMDNNVWGTAWFTPSDYQADIIETRVFCTDGGTLRPLDARTTSPRPPPRSARRTARSTSASPRPTRRSATSTPPRCTPGSSRAWARLAGCYDEIDWSISPGHRPVLRAGPGSLPRPGAHRRRLRTGQFMHGSVFPPGPST